MKINPLLRELLCSNKLKKVFSIMRLSFLMAFLFVCHSFAFESEAQNTVIELRNSTITYGELFKEIENQTDFLIVYSDVEVNLKSEVKVRTNKMKVTDCLKDVLDKTNLKFEIVNNYIILSKKGEKSIAQQSNRIKITGTVTDQKGEAIPGANVVEKGTTNGTMSDMNGKFSLELSPNSSITVSYIGYNHMEIPVKGNKIFNIKLTEDNQVLDEVVVVAYGTTKKSSFTGSASVVKADQLEKISGSGFTEALQGMSTGVQVSNYAGNPGAEARIQIRGISSMSGSSNPLYIVDGMPYDGGLNAINPSDIESLTVLKDAAASSLYGSRAANGVIIITTKKGASGKATVNFRAAWGTSDNAVANPKTVADPKETLLMNWEAFYNDNYYYTGGMTKQQAGDLASSAVVSKSLKAIKNSKGESAYVSPFVNGIDPTQWVQHDGNGNAYINPNLQYAWDSDDWDVYNAAFSRKLRQDYSIDVSGATENGKTNYYVSIGHLNDGGYLLSQYYKRYNFRANVTSDINNWLQMGGGLSYTYYRQNTTGSNRALIYSSTLTSPWLRNVDNTDWIYSEKTGKRMYSYGDYFNSFFGIHPINNNGDYWDNDNDESFSNTDGHNMTARYFVNFKLPYHFNFKSSVNYDSSIGNSYGYGSAIHGSAQKAPYGVTVMDSGGSASRSSSELLSLTWNNVLNWEYSYGKNNIDAMLGHEVYTYSTYYHYGYGEGIMQMGQYEIANATTYWEATSSKDRYSLVSLFGKVNYNYDNKYYLSGSYRRDGSSRFSKNNRWGNFYSLGASWRISKENFLEDSEWLQNLVLRASYGTSGNDRLIARQSNGKPGNEVLYGYQGVYESDNLYTIAGLQPSAIETPELQWEKNKQFNVAVDFTIFKDLTASVEYYTRESEDLLYNKTLPLSAQVGSVTGVNTNIGTLRNSGFEFSVNARPIHNKDFSWTIDANLSTLKNKIVSLPSEPFFWSNTISTYYMCEGNSLYDFYAPKTGGIDEETGRVIYYKADGSTTFKASDMTRNDYVKIGSALPNVYGSLTNSFNYKGIDLSFMFYYSLGSHMYDYEYYERTRVRYQTSALTDLVADRWRNPGDKASIPLFTMNHWAEYMGYCDRYIFKNDYLRLRNLTIGYTLPTYLTRKFTAQRLRVYFSGDNLLTFVKAKDRYVDPETGLSGNNYNGNSETDSGIQGSRRVFMGGIQLTF